MSVNTISTFINTDRESPPKDCSPRIPKKGTPPKRRVDDGGSATRRLEMIILRTEQQLLVSDIHAHCIKELHSQVEETSIVATFKSLFCTGIARPSSPATSYEPGLISDLMSPFDPYEEYFLEGPLLIYLFPQLTVEEMHKLSIVQMAEVYCRAPTLFHDELYRDGTKFSKEQFSYWNKVYCEK